MTTVNSQYFDNAQVESGQFQRFLQVLMDGAYDDSKYYNDIHIYPADCQAFIIEWCQRPWSGEFGGQFEFVDEDAAVMIEKEFPDGHYEYFHNEEEYEDELADWLKEHPNYGEE